MVDSVEVTVWSSNTSVDAVLGLAGSFKTSDEIACFGKSKTSDEIACSGSFKTVDEMA